MRVRRRLEMKGRNIPSVLACFIFPAHWFATCPTAVQIVFNVDE
jgi:hypothetical protein